MSGKRIGWLWGLLCPLVSVQAQTGLIHGDLVQPPAWAARSAAMGNADVAVSDPETAGWSNPAASSMLPGIQAGVSIQLKTAGMFSLQNQNNPDHVYTMQPASQNALNAAGFNVPLQYKKHPVVVGFHLRNLADLQTRYLWRSKRSGTDDYSETEIKREGALYALAVRAATRFASSFSAGLQVAVLGGRQMADTSYTVYEQNSRDFARSQWQNRFSGYCVEIGYQWRINAGWTIGQNFILPYTQKLKDIEMNNLTLQRSYADVLAMRLPAQVWSGVAWRLGTNLLVAADYRFRPWTKLRFDSPAALQFSDAHSLHVGLEYRLPVNHNVIPLRIGWHNQPKQMYDYNAADPAQAGKQVVSSSLTGGFGMYLGSLQLEAAMDMERLKYPTSWYLIGERPVQVRQTRYHFTISLMYLL